MMVRNKQLFLCSNPSSTLTSSVTFGKTYKALQDMAPDYNSMSCLIPSCSPYFNHKALLLISGQDEQAPTSGPLHMLPLPGQLFPQANYLEHYSFFQVFLKCHFFKRNIPSYTMRNDNDRDSTIYIHTLLNVSLWSLRRYYICVFVWLSVVYSHCK